MATIPGSVPLTGFIAPTDDQDTYAVADVNYIKGGYRSVATLIERDAITAARRVEGMAVYVLDQASIFILDGDLVTWNLFIPGATGNFLPLAGGTLTGPLTLDADPGNAYEASTKNYVDNSVSGLATNNSVNLKVDRAGDAMEGYLQLHANPTDNKHASTKEYVDLTLASVVNGMKWKDCAIGVITADEPIVTTVIPYVTNDGVSLNVGDRVVRNSVTNPNLNGIYIVRAIAAGTWLRAPDADTSSELRQAVIAIQQGTVYADKLLMVSNDAAITVGTTPINWVTIGQALSYSAGSGLSLSGTTFSVDGTVARTTTTPVVQSGVILSLDSPLQTRATVNNTPEAINITSLTNPGPGKSVQLRVTSYNAGDTFNFNPSGYTVFTTGFYFIPGLNGVLVNNFIFIQQISSNEVMISYNPMV
jgi:hypothetical protein